MSADRCLVTATYRLQLHAGYTFADAAGQVEYLAQLGVSHLYLSPILEAVPGSQHGYDVLDHRHINPELGGPDGLRALAEAAHRHGLGIVVDVVPNHMALVAPQWRNSPLWETLLHGEQGPTSHWFDVDWAALDGRFGLPLLGESLEAELAAGAITLSTGAPHEGPAAGQPVIRYHDHVLPVAAGRGGEHAIPAESTDPEVVAQVLAQQHYLLAGWREADTVLNYRRFFEVDSLLAVRVEQQDVFEDTHRVLLQAHHAGWIDGFRIDHPDGLADPAGYLRRLTQACRPGTPIWVEKILEGPERLPADWACAGTTGYDGLAVLQRALTPASAADPIGAVVTQWAATGGSAELEPVVLAAKRQAATEALTPEIERLLRRLREVLPEQDPTQLREALVTLLVHLDVYRVYAMPQGWGDPTDEPVNLEPLLAAQRAADAERPELAATTALLVEVVSDPTSPKGARAPQAHADLMIRFGQTTGPVMAKGIEDTAFYRWQRLVALNEVGGDPAAAPDVAALHDWAAHQARHWPRGMTTLSTHDTKRSEGVRARLLALASDDEQWRRCSQAAQQAADQRGVDRPTGHLIWQTVAGVHPAASERVQNYLQKAIREAKEHTTWVDPDPDYEAGVAALAEAALEAGSDLAGVIAAAVVQTDDRARAITLQQKALQLLLPGVPDLYQGNELLDLSLVDPDNRRPVDYPDRASRLQRLQQAAPPADLSDEVLLLTHRLLRLRQDHPELADGAGYRPLPTAPGQHQIGFERAVAAGRIAVLTRPASTGADEPTVAALAGLTGRWRDVIGERNLEAVQTDPAATFAGWPVIVLFKEES